MLTCMPELCHLTTNEIENITHLYMWMLACISELCDLTNKCCSMLACMSELCDLINTCHSKSYTFGDFDVGVYASSQNYVT